VKIIEYENHYQLGNRQIVGGMRMNNWKKVLITSFLVSALAMHSPVSASSINGTPAKPVITGADVINFSQNSKNYSIKGKGITGALIKITVTDGKTTISGQSKVQNNGTFEIPVNYLKLSDGWLSLTVIQTKNGKSASIKKSLLKDTKLPGNPVLENRGFINAKVASNYTVKGKAEPQAAIKLTVSDGKNSATQLSKVDKKGNFSVPFNLSQLEEGKINLSAELTDAAGNKRIYKKADFLIKDTLIVEDVPTVIGDAYANAANVDIYNVAGFGEPGELVQVTIKDGKNPALSQETEVDEEGFFSVDFDLTTFPDGTLTVTAKYVDVAGNESESSEDSIIKDTVIPSPATNISSVAINENSKFEAYQVTGSGLPGATVEVLLSDGMSEISTIGSVSKDGKFNIPVNVSSLNDGDIAMTIVQISEAGNVGEEVKTTIKKDTVVTSPMVTNWKFIEPGNLQAYEIKGTAEAHSLIYLTVTDGEKTLTEKVKSDANGHFILKINLSSLISGNLTFALSQKDVSGNVSPSIIKTIYKSY
jgi:hypothetical protein